MTLQVKDILITFEVIHLIYASEKIGLLFCWR